MALKGAHSDPDQGIKGAKPRLREPKVPRRKETATTARLGEIYLRRRNMMMKLKIMREALALGIARDQLVEKRLVEHQLGCMLVPMRQKLLAIPLKIGHRFGRNGQAVEVREIVAFVQGCVHEALQEIIDLPRAADADWMKKMEEEEGAR
jgi:hypothetical protein